MSSISKILESVSIRWDLPSYNEEKNEFKRYHLSSDDIDELKDQFRSSNMTELSDYVWSNLGNTDSWRTDTYKKAVELAVKYRKDYKVIIKAMLDEKYIKAPIILKRKGKYDLVAGNTRLMLCKAFGIRPKVLIISLKSKMNESMPHDEFKPTWSKHYYTVPDLEEYLGRAATLDDIIYYWKNFNYKLTDSPQYHMKLPLHILDSIKEWDREECPRNTEEENAELEASIRTYGYKTENPMIVHLSKTSSPYVGEGCHRIMILKRLGYSPDTLIPVKFTFSNEDTGHRKSWTTPEDEDVMPEQEETRQVSRNKDADNILNYLKSIGIGESTQFSKNFGDAYDYPSFETIDVNDPLQNLQNVADEAVHNLKFYGKDLSELSPSNPSDLLILADACNWAAKTYDESFYWYKPYLVIAAIEAGADGGINRYGIWSLYTPQAGTSTYHDPYGECLAIWSARHPNEQPPLWKEEWHGIPRQFNAFNVAQDRIKGDGRFLNFYKQSTADTQEPFGQIKGNRIYRNWIKTVPDTNEAKAEEYFGNELFENKSKASKLLNRKTLTVAELAKKYGVSKEEVLKKVKKGIEVESKEHTKDKSIASEIARDHLGEDFFYYEKLKKIEERYSNLLENFAIPKRKTESIDEGFMYYYESDDEEENTIEEELIRELYENPQALLIRIDEKKKKKKKADRCVKIAKRKYHKWPSAYASGAVVKCRQGKIWKGVKESKESVIFEIHEFSEDYIVELLEKKYKPVKDESLKKWFDRNNGKGWIDCKTGKPCGRKKAGRGTDRKYPACRPTKAHCNKVGTKRKKGPDRVSWKSKSETKESITEINWKGLATGATIGLASLGAGKSHAAPPKKTCYNSNSKKRYT